MMLAGRLDVAENKCNLLVSQQANILSRINLHILLTWHKGEFTLYEGSYTDKLTHWRLKSKLATLLANVS